MKIRDGLSKAFAGMFTVAILAAARGQSLAPDEIVTVARAAAAQEPITNKTVPVWSLEAFGLAGTYWMLQTDTPPLPYNPFPELPVVAVTTNIFLVDDRSVDYPALTAEQNEVFSLRSLSRSGGMMTLSSGVPELPGEGGGGGTNEPPVFEPPSFLSSTGLCLYPPVFTSSNTLLLVITNGVEDAPYDLFMTTNLAPGATFLNLTNWAWLYRSAPGQTNFTLTNYPTPEAYFTLGTTNDTDEDGLTDAYEWLVHHSDPNTWSGPVIVTQPLSQTVDLGDLVAFAVVAEGVAPLNYQWRRDGSDLPGETNASLTFPAAIFTDAGDYSVAVSSSVGLPMISSNATLVVANPNFWPVVIVTGPRQNYTFKNGMTYYLGSRVELHGTTTIEGGAVIKPDWYYPSSSLAIMGSLVCKTDDPYFPAFITSADDNSVGESLQFEEAEPVTATNGAAYLDFTGAQDAVPVLNNLRIRYANQAVVTPADKSLEVWNCQFVQCGTTVVAGANSAVGLHNVLLRACGTAVDGDTNYAALFGEQVTADVTNLWSGTAPGQIALTNSIIVGNVASGPALLLDHVALNPTGIVFQATGAGGYYLTNTSAYRWAGTTNISARLRAEFRQKTTQPPLVLPPFMNLPGELTLGPQVARYTNGAPDYGFHYAALDYVVAWVTNRGRITVLPGTAVGLRNEYVAARDLWAWCGFDAREGSTFTSRGFPDRPIVFADVQLVQERLAWACGAAFVPDFWPGGGPNVNVAPVLDFRFTRFYVNARQYHVWAGYEENCGYLPSPDSLVEWTLRDCELHGGRVNLGPPDDGYFYGAPMDWYYGAGSVTWMNNLFDTVAVTLNPAYYWYNGATNCDLTFVARHNLFRGGKWFCLSPVPASGGNWEMTDNLFEKVTFAQDTFAPLEFHHNGYWPLTSRETLWAWAQWGEWHFPDYYGYPLCLSVTNQLQVATNGGGGNEILLASAPPYQRGPLGDYYLPVTTPLYQAGSQTAGESGLYRYTVRTNQVTEGEEFAAFTNNASIGLHYVATASAASLPPRDADGDGIPDYVEDTNGNGVVEENETSAVLVETISGTLDSTNAVYDEADVDGDGLSGRAERLLTTNPLLGDNPLVLTPLITGAEPFAITYSLPVAPELVASNSCVLSLLENGNAARACELVQSNGIHLAVWTTTFASPGQHFLQPTLRLPGARLPLGDTIPDTRVLRVSGPLRSERVEHLLTFDPECTSFGSQANITATLQVQSADYAISFYDVTNNLLRTLIGHTDIGSIDEVWDLTTTNGTPCGDAEFNASLLLTPTGEGQTNAQSFIYPLGLSRCSGSGDAFSLAFGWNTLCDLSFRSAMLRLGVVNLLFSPIANNTYAHTPLNCYDCDPFFMYSTSAQTNLLNDLADPGVGNFYWYGHGSESAFGAAKSDGDVTAGLSYISAFDLGNKLGNVWKKGRLRRGHAFRLVIMECCDSAKNSDLALSFGIEGGNHSREWFARHGRSPQAYVGWAKEIFVPGCPPYNDHFTSHSLHQADMFSLWMCEVPLMQCLAAGSTPHVNIFGVPVPFDAPLDPDWRIFGDPNLTRTPINEP